MVAGRGADHTSLEFFRWQLGHLVVGATQFEAEDALHILALEIDPVAIASRQGRGQFKRGFCGNVIDARGEDFLQVVGSHDVWWRVRGTKTARWLRRCSL